MLIFHHLQNGGERMSKRYVSLLCILGVIVSIICGMYLYKHQDIYKPLYDTIDQSKEEVMIISAASSGASLALSFIPGDTATPIAEKLADLSTYLMVTLCVLYLEEFLLPILGIGTIIIAFPVCFAGVMVFNATDRIKLRNILIKFMASLIIINCIIPTSVFASKYIRNNFSHSISETIDKTLEMSKVINECLDYEESFVDSFSSEETMNLHEDEAIEFAEIEIETIDVVPEEISDELAEEIFDDSIELIDEEIEHGMFDWIFRAADVISGSYDKTKNGISDTYDKTVNSISNAYDKTLENIGMAYNKASASIKGAAESVTKSAKSIINGVADTTILLVKLAKNILNNMINTVAIIVVTSCLIPLITLLVFDRLMILLFKIDVIDVAKNQSTE